MAQHVRTRAAGGTSATPRRPIPLQGRSAAGALPQTPAPPTPAPAQVSAQAPTTFPSSPVCVLLTNMRLLDLDLATDWPDMTTATFSGSSQNHKRRVQAVEWALYRLFEIWDQETALKLKPYFPAADQMQSVNLRAALLRGLETLKKNGVLGRDAVIRKTMLDECKGERLEEVLASFSSAVLRHTLSTTTRRTSGGRARVLAVEAAVSIGGSDDEGGNLLLRPLILAHRVSLRRTLERRRDDDARFRDFGDLLAMKERVLARRHEALGPGAGATRGEAGAAKVSEDARRSVRQTVRNYWAGHEGWMDTLLKGDAAARQQERRGLLGAEEESVWRCVREGRLAELEDEGRGLLRQLGGRVEAQRRRLTRWEEICRAMEAGENEAVLEAGRARRRRRAVVKAEEDSSGGGIDLRFNAHQNLQVGGGTDLKSEASSHTAYEAAILRDLDRELAGIKRSSFGQAMRRLESMCAQHGRTRTEASIPPSSDGISELSDMDGADEEDVEFRQRLPTERRPVSGVFNDTSGGASTASTSTSTYCGKKEHKSTYLGSRRGKVEWRQDEDGAVDVETEDGAREDEELQQRGEVAPKGREGATGKTRRHMLSLAERTRMSMARKSMQFLEEEEEEETLSGGVGEEDGEGGDLASRTRKSMVGFERARQKAREDRLREARREMRRARALPRRREGSQWEE